MERPCYQPLGYHVILAAALILCALIASCALFFVPNQSSAVRTDLGFFFLPVTQSLSPATSHGPRRRQQRGTPGRRRSADNADPCPAESERTAGEQTPCHRLPQALIIGVKKGGTRALLEFIRLHPDVRAVGPETHFFDRNYDRGLGWYRSRMPPTTSTQLTMEKTPSYFVTKFAPGRIHRMSRDIKLLVVLRDPVTRAISDYAQTASKRPEVKSFEQLVFANATTGLVDTSWSAIRIGTYCQHLERWLRYFPLNRIHFVPAEGLVHEPAAEMARVEQFLGLKPYINQSHFFFNETKGFPCVWRPQHRGGGGPHCLGKTKGRHHPAVSEETLQILRNFYKPFNAKLYELTGINFGWQR